MLAVNKLGFHSFLRAVRVIAVRLRFNRKSVNPRRGRAFVKRFVRGVRAYKQSVLAVQRVLRLGYYVNRFFDAFSAFVSVSPVIVGRGRLNGYLVSSDFVRRSAFARGERGSSENDYFVEVVRAENFYRRIRIPAR